MPLEEFTVDTLGTLAAPEAFAKGRLSASPAAMPWSSGPDLLTCIVASVTILLFLLSLSKFFRVFPHIFAGTFRWRRLENIEDSVSLSRDRNTVAAAMLPALSLIFSFYGVFSPELLSGLHAGMHSLAALAVMAVILLLRRMFVDIARPHKMSYDTASTLGHVFHDFIIAETALLYATAGAAWATGINSLTVRIIMMYESAFLFAVFLVRKYQIAGPACANVKTFLYLCIPEIFAVGAVFAISAYV